MSAPWHQMNSEQHVCHLIISYFLAQTVKTVAEFKKNLFLTSWSSTLKHKKLMLYLKKKRLGDQSMITPHSFHNLHYPRKSAVNRKSRRPHTSCHYIHLCLIKLWVIHKGPGFQSYKRIVGTHSAQNFLKTLEENKCIWQTFCAYFAKILP